VFSTWNFFPEGAPPAEPVGDGGAVEPPDDGGSVEPLDDGGAVEPPDDGGSVEPLDDGGSVEPPDDGGSVEPPDDGGAVTAKDDGVIARIATRAKILNSEIIDFDFIVLSDNLYFIKTLQFLFYQ
jgi:hypothetical protein